MENANPRRTRVRNVRCAADAERPGHLSGRDAPLTLDQTGHRNPACAFDKCSVLEIKNSALFLAIAVSDIKDIKRGRTLSATPDQSPAPRCERPGHDIERRIARLIIDYFSAIKNSAVRLANVVPEIKQIKRRRTLSGPQDQSFGRAMGEHRT